MNIKQSILSAVGALAIAVGGAGVGVEAEVLEKDGLLQLIEQEHSTTELVIYYIYSNDEGAYFLEPTAEFENVIFVEHEALDEWGITNEELHHGDKFIGIFDADGWELFNIIEFDEDYARASGKLGGACE